MRTKNRKARVLPISGEVAEIFKRREVARRIEHDGRIRFAEFIFHRGDDGPMGEFKKTWARACVASKLGAMVCPTCHAEGNALTCEPCNKATRYCGRIWHDFRRSAIRHLIKSGASVQEAKAWSGHKSDSVFFRYSILTTDDLKKTQDKAERYRKNSLARESKIRAMR
jgi:integrase